MPFPEFIELDRPQVSPFPDRLDFDLTL